MKLLCFAGEYNVMSYQQQDSMPCQKEFVIAFQTPKLNETVTELQLILYKT